MPDPKPNSILRKWLATQDTSIYQLMQILNCTYSHAWSVVRGRRDVTPETLGKLLIAFGADGPAPLMAEHMRHLLEPATANGKGK